MPRQQRGRRIQINPDNRYDLSHLTADEARQTLQHIVQDLCFWGPLLVENHNTAHYHHQNNNNNVERGGVMGALFRHERTTSNGSGDTNSSSRKKKNKDGAQQRADRLPPLRGQVVRNWKTATDPSTGQTYYYDPVTRQTQWEKPEEIRAMEKQQKKERRQRDKVFFAEMERNCRSHLAAGRLTLEHTATELLHYVGGPPKEPLGLQVPSKQQRIRTISAMDERMLAQVDVESYSPMNSYVESSVSSASNSVSNNKPPPPHHPPRPPVVADPPTLSNVPGRPPLPSRTSSSSAVSEESSPENDHKDGSRKFDRWDSLELSPDNTSSHALGSPELQGMRLLDENPLYQTTPPSGGSHQQRQEHPVIDEEKQQTQGHMRRNTGNTMFVNSTMTSPDIQGTIRCVCGVYRAHILQSIESPSNSPGSVVPVGSTVVNPEVFRDDLHGIASNNTSNNNGSSRKFGTPDRNLAQKLPTLEEIENFYKEFFRRSQMEHDTIIMSLIYIERLIKRTQGSIQPTPLNWRSMLFGCMILASKVWDDLSMWNIDFSNVSVATGLSSFTIQRINQLEIALLSILRFDVRVPASEYAKYYFLIRTMLFRSGQLLSVQAVSQNVPPLSSSTAVDNRRTKSVDWGAEPLLKDASLEQLLSRNNTVNVQKA